MMQAEVKLRDVLRTIEARTDAHHWTDHVARARLALGEVLMATGRAPAARPEFGAAASIFSKHQVPELSLDLARSLDAWAQADAAANDVSSARKHAAQSAAIWARHPGLSRSPALPPLRDPSRQQVRFGLLRRRLEADAHPMSNDPPNDTSGSNEEPESDRPPAVSVAPEALAERFAALYPELRRLAQSKMRREDTWTLLDTTSLLHESFLRLSDRGDLASSELPAFLAYASQVMRSVIVDHARARLTQRRSAHAEHLPLDTELGERLATPESEVMDIHQPCACWRKRSQAWPRWWRCSTSAA